MALLVTSEDEGTGRSCDLCGNLQHGRWCLGSIYGGDDPSCFVVGGVRRRHLQRCFEFLSRCGNINIPKTSGSRCKSEFYATKNVSYTHLIHKLLRDNLQKPPRQPPGNDRWRETLELHHSLRLAGLQESPGSLNPVATAAGRGRSWLRVISSLEDELLGVTGSPDRPLFCWCLTWFWCQLLQELRCQDVAALGAVIAASAQSYQWKTCLDIVGLIWNIGAYQRHAMQ